MNFAIITSCTNRKSQVGNDLHFSMEKGDRSLLVSAIEWASHANGVIKSAADVVKVSQLYQGRSFTESIRVAGTLRARLLVVSAGLGLLDIEDLAFPYNLSVSDKDNALFRLISRTGSTNSQWWDALRNAGLGRGSIASVVEKEAVDAKVLIALPSTYLSMVSQDLISLSDESLVRVRILTHPGSMAILPQRLQELVMPYDERLQSIRQFAGTRSDFAQRALSHFVLGLGAHDLPLESAKQAVTRAMERLSHVKLPTRRRASDDVILNHIADHWDRTNGHGNRLLRVLRDDLLVSCEQGRFQGLWRQYKAQMDGAKENVT
jgi:hypothetical protein